MNFEIIRHTETQLRYYYPPERALYSFKSGRGRRVYVKCINRTCQCKAVIVNNTNFTRTNPQVNHDHIDNHDFEASVDRAYSALRDSVRRDHRTPIDTLHSDALRAVPANVAGRIAWDNVNRTLRRIRLRQLPSCRSYEALFNLLEDTDGSVYNTFGSIREHRFYQGAPDGNLVFANLALISHIRPQFQIFLDGTFGITPFRQRQLLVILAVVAGRPRPIVYAVMHGQTVEDYRAVLEFVRDAIISYDGVLRTPTSAMSDFEQSIRIALTLVWNGIELHGCGFHLNQAQQRNARSDPRLVRNIIGATMHRRVLRMLMRLNLLPLNRVMIGYQAIVDYIDENGLMRDFRSFLRYFRATWFVRFPIETWNVSEERYRTNNHLEGYNNRIKRTIPRSPNCWAFLDGLLVLAHHAISQFEAEFYRNAPPPPDRSRLTIPFRAALLLLNNGDLDELGFLLRMANVHLPEDDE